jgi:hypothetical protein
MKILITGDRNWTDVEVIRSALVDIEFKPGDALVHGAARGADSIAASIAQEMNGNVLPFPANWEKYGRAAGAIRNQQMLDENPDIDVVLAFHPDIKQSKGTKDMVTRCYKKGLRILIHDGKSTIEQTSIFSY